MATLEQRRPNTALKVSSDPAAGSEHSFTINEACVLKFGLVQLVTDANAANRTVHFTIEDESGNVYARLTAGGTQAASLTRQYSLQPNDFASPAATDTNFVVCVPANGIPLRKNGKIKTVTTNKQAGDDYGVITLFVERY